MKSTRSTIQERSAIEYSENAILKLIQYTYTLTYNLKKNPSPVPRGEVLPRDHAVPAAPVAAHLAVLAHLVVGDGAVHHGVRVGRAVAVVVGWILFEVS